MIAVAVTLEFSVAKRLVDYSGKCNFLHGYNHVIETYFTANGDDNNGEMVIDFYEIKAKLGGWIDENLDHNVILNKKDQPLGQSIASITGQEIFYMDCDPTSENLASYIKNIVCPELFSDVRCSKIRLFDSQSAFVEVT